MAQVTLPYNLTAGSPENVNNLMSNLNALKDGVNTIDTAQLAAASVTAPKLAAGSIVQVVEASYTTQTAITATTYTDTGLSGSITPNATSNKVLILVSLCHQIERNDNGWCHGYINICRNTTQLREFGRFTGHATRSSDDNYQGYAANTFYSYLDSPSSTSSVTYKCQGKVHVTTGAQQLTAQAYSFASVMTLIEVRA